MEHLNYEQISNGKVSKCYKAGNIVKKIYNLENNRMQYEIAALTTLRHYRCFPYLYKVDKENKTIYMSYVGISFKDIKNKKDIPLNLQDQVDLLISYLKQNNIFHRDLSISHFRVVNNIISLIDFEKCWFTKEQYDFNKTNNTGCWEKLKYHNMDYIKNIINTYLKITFKNDESILIL